MGEDWNRVTEVRTSRLKLSLLASILSLWLPGAALAQSAFDSGVRMYEAGRYAEAMLHLSQATGAEPENARAHYHLANTLVRLGMHPQAAQEYEICYRLDPRGSMADYCRAALRAYKRPVPAIEQTRAGAALTAGGGAQAVYTTASGYEESNHLDRTKSVIRRQAEYEKSKHEYWGKSAAELVLRQAEGERKRIAEEASLEKERAFQPQPVYLPRGGVYIPPPPSPELVRMRHNEIERQARERSERARILAEGRAREFAQFSRERQVALDEVAQNLERQLDAPHRAGSAHLQPIGTDLYVRYYGYAGMERTAPPEVRPAIVRIVGHRGSQLSLPPAPEAGDAAPRAVKRVSGKVLDAPLTRAETRGYDPR